MMEWEMGMFLSGLKQGDKAFVGHSDGAIHEIVSIARVKGNVIEVYSTRLLPWQQCRFSRKTGKQHGGELVLAPYDEARHKEHVERCAKAEEERKKRKEAERQIEREANRLTVIACVSAFESEALSALSDEDLRALAGILKKLG